MLELRDVRDKWKKGMPVTELESYIWEISKLEIFPEKDAPQALPIVTVWFSIKNFAAVPAWDSKKSSHVKLYWKSQCKAWFDIFQSGFGYSSNSGLKKNVPSETLLTIQLKALPNTLKVKLCWKWNFIDPFQGFNKHFLN